MTPEQLNEEASNRLENNRIAACNTRIRKKSHMEALVNRIESYEQISKNQLAKISQLQEHIAKFK